VLLADRRLLWPNWRRRRRRLAGPLLAGLAALGLGCAAFNLVLDLSEFYSIENAGTEALFPWVVLSQLLALGACGALALAADVRPARPRWWARVRDTLTTLCSDLLRRASRRAHACPVPAVVRIAKPREERTHVW
jgi:hypothetical protein